MKPFLLQQLNRYAERLAELDFLLFAVGIGHDFSTPPAPGLHQGFQGFGEFLLGRAGGNGLFNRLFDLA